MIEDDARRCESYVEQQRERAEQKPVRAKQAEERANRLAARWGELGLAKV